LPESSTRTIPIWFGPAESPMFGLLHLPGSTARGGVVLCPPLGHEYMNSHSTFRELANRIAPLGFVVLRFDYRSTGDSFDRAGSGPEESGFVGDVRAATGYLRELGLTWVATIGMRLGASFAAAQNGLSSADSLVLWDPCPSGRSFLREQHLLSLVAARGRPKDPGQLEIPGFTGSAEMSDEIASLNLRDHARSVAGQVLLLTRADRPADAKLVESFAGAKVEHRQVSGQRELLDVESPRLTVPFATILTIADWVNDVAPDKEAPIRHPEAREVQVDVESGHYAASSRDAEGVRTSLRETSLSVGPARLFAIATEPTKTASGPTCIFVSVANEHRVGPGRLWVELSRRLSVAGFRCARVDINGYGESPVRDSAAGPKVFATSHIDDVIDVARALSPERPGEVVLFGLCSSAYHILEAALALRPSGVCALNPIVIFHPPELDSDGKVDPRRQCCVPQTRLLTMARRRASLRSLRLRLPSLDWKVRGPLRTINWRIRIIFSAKRDVPSACLERLASSGVDVLLVCGSADATVFQHIEFERYPDDAKKLLHYVYMPTLSHTLFSAEERNSVMGMIVEHMVERFGETKLSSPTL
jgi:pimeloyl-ACP methyl ester carboxylesterase